MQRPFVKAHMQDTISSVCVVVVCVEPEVVYVQVSGGGARAGERQCQTGRQERRQGHSSHSSGTHTLIDLHVHIDVR